MAGLYNPPLQVVGFVGTRAGDADRGPQVRLQPFEAHLRMLADGDLAWVYGPRRHDLASVRIDDSIPRGGAVLRDILGVAPSEVIRLVRATADREILTIPDKP